MYYPFYPGYYGSTALGYPYGIGYPYGGYPHHYPYFGYGGCYNNYNPYGYCGRW